LIIRILLTWFPGIDWSNGILSALTSITDPYLNIFRGIIPPIGGFDISSLLAFLLLNVIQNLITNLQYASLGYG
jgi:YggT family protein